MSDVSSKDRGLFRQVRDWFKTNRLSALQGDILFEGSPVWNKQLRDYWPFMVGAGQMSIIRGQADAQGKDWVAWLDERGLLDEILQEISAGVLGDG